MAKMTRDPDMNSQNLEMDAMQILPSQRHGYKDKIAQRFISIRKLHYRKK
jgi:hypothetical protein